MPIVVLIYCTKYQSALQNSGVHNSSEDSIAQMPRQSNNINRLLLSAFRKRGGDEKIHQDLTLMMMMMMMTMMMMMLAWKREGGGKMWRILILDKSHTIYLSTPTLPQILGQSGGKKWSWEMFSLLSMTTVLLSKWVWRRKEREKGFLLSMTDRESGWWNCPSKGRLGEHLIGPNSNEMLSYPPKWLPTSPILRPFLIYAELFCRKGFIDYTGCFHVYSGCTTCCDKWKSNWALFVSEYIR